jgi:hypothetical protein
MYNARREYNQKNNIVEEESDISDDDKDTEGSENEKEEDNGSFKRKCRR